MSKLSSKILIFIILTIGIIWGARQYTSTIIPIAQNPITPPAIIKPKTGQNEINYLKIEDIKEGKGAEVKKGDKVRIHYRGFLENGKEFDSSYTKDIPLEFTLGRGEVIKGMEEGILGMKTGGKRKITIPPDLGYGSRGIPGVIPLNSTLIFEVELIDILTSSSE